MTIETLPQDFVLNNGTRIPALGLGTWKSEPGEVSRAVCFALRNGYRHIDAALIYGNEQEVGQGIRDSGVKREDIFVTSKLWNTHHPNAAEGLQKSLDALGLDYLDLYLIHWPVRLVPNESSELLPVNPDGTRSVDRTWDQAETWRQMEDLYRSGKVKAIGVANWSIPYLERLKKTWEIVPAVNQVELHPFLPQHKLKTYCEDHGIILEAYSPLGSTGAPLMHEPVINQMATEHSVSASIILLSYHVNRGCVVLPKSITEARILQNKELISLSAKDMAKLDSLATAGKAKRINTPLWGHDLGFDDWYDSKE